MMESRVDTQARRPSLASVVGTRERERREIPHDVSSDPARQRLHFDPAKPCLGRAGRECPGSRRRRLEADVGDVRGRVPVRQWRPRESHPRVIPAYPGLSRIKTFDRPHCARSSGYIDVPLKFGDVLLETGNIGLRGSPGAYGVWLKRVADGWRLVFNDEPDAWGTQHNPEFDAAEVDLDYTQSNLMDEAMHDSSRALSASVVMTTPEQGHFLLVWGPHEWTADFTVAR